MRLYVVGGQQRGGRPISGGLDWYEFQKGVIVEVDTESGTGQLRVEYVSPPEACVEEDPVVLFKSATLVGDRFFVCTQTEVLATRCRPSSGLPTYQYRFSMTFTTLGPPRTELCLLPTPAWTWCSRSPSTVASYAS